MIANKDIIFFSSIEWNFLWQAHQEIASRLAAAGNRVLYIENTGIRSLQLKDSGRVMRRMKNWGRSLHRSGVHQVAENIYVCSPLVLPPFGPAWQRYLNLHLFLPLIVRAVRKLGFRDPILWSYLPTDTALNLVELLKTPKSVVIYYCADNFSQIATSARELEQTELRLLGRSDLVFATCDELAHNCRRAHNNTHVFPPGVSLEAFPPENSIGGAHSRNGSSQPGDWLRRLPRPVIGYVGGVHSHIDFRLLREIAQSRPEWSLVLVGTVQTSIRDLDRLPNVHFVGHQPHAALAGYMQAFDVCIVPYVSSAYTSTVVPTKINEYLAAGRAVVSTNLPAVAEFNRRYNVLHTSSPRGSDFLLAIERALEKRDDSTIRATRRRVAELADWRLRIEAMSQLIQIQLDAKQTHGLRGASL